MNQKRFLLVLVTAAVLSLIYFLVLKPSKNKETEKKEMLSVKKHSEAFNRSIEDVMKSYFLLKDAFVEADTSSVKAKARELIKVLNAIDTLELKKDTASVYNTVLYTITDLKLNAESMLSQHNIQEMRKDFSSLSDMMYPAFFQTVNYEGPTIYLQNCPMAFDDSIPANWISETREVFNPYLGKKHPEYQAGMLHCGELKDSISAH